jgi:hypothetical protein
LAVLLGKGDGTFEPAVFPYTSSISTGWPPGLLTADLNGDGKADLVAIVGVSYITGSNSGILVLLGKGDGAFKALPLFCGNCSVFLSAPVALVDLNGDGKLDIISADQQFQGHSRGGYTSNGVSRANSQRLSQSALRARSEGNRGPSAGTHFDIRTRRSS